MKQKRPFNLHMCPSRCVGFETVPFPCRLVTDPDGESGTGRVTHPESKVGTAQRGSGHTCTPLGGREDIPRGRAAAGLGSDPFRRVRKALLLQGQGHCDWLGSRKRAHSSSSALSQLSPDPSTPAVTSHPVRLWVPWPQKDKSALLQHLLQRLAQGDIYHLHPSSSCPTTSLCFVHNERFQLVTFIVPPTCEV